MTQAGVQAQREAYEQYGSNYGTRTQTTTFYRSPLGRPQNTRGGRGSDRTGGQPHRDPFLNVPSREDYDRWFGLGDRDMQSETFDPGSER